MVTEPPTVSHAFTLFLLTLLTTGYVVGVAWMRRARRRQGMAPALTRLPDADQPPPSAVGWPPQGARFTTYVVKGVAALDAYLDDDFAA